MNALLIVDLQNDFLPGGALPATEGDRIIPVINKLAELFPLVAASRDWHPEHSIHFEKWPPHCIRETEGAEFPKQFDKKKLDHVFLKGTGNVDDGYSAFQATSDDLASYLHDHRVDHLFICGLTTEYCVRETVLDALKNGFKVTVIQDAVAGIEANPGDGEKAYAEMQKEGANMTRSNNLGL
jgi:nicotinamidase/pyrazinamidase